MGKINTGRVILGGLAAGLVMNVSEAVLHAVVLREEGEKLVQLWQEKGLLPEVSSTALVWVILLTFALGIAAVWTYAAIRPRFGPGPGTALVAALAVWAMSYLYAGIYLHAGILIVPPKVVWLPIGWSLFEVPVATLLGAWLYRE
jgi:hypothetical protein